jgi:hypothetical protein
MNKFILKFISKKKLNYIKNSYIEDNKSPTEYNNLYSDAITYSKYYLYWKIFGCVYQNDIMNLLYDIEYIN